MLRSSDAAGSFLAPKITASVHQFPPRNLGLPLSAFVHARLNLDLGLVQVRRISSDLRPGNFRISHPSALLFVDF